MKYIAKNKITSRWHGDKKRKNGKRYQLLIFDYHTGLFDTKSKKRVDELLRPEVRNAGIYQENPIYIKFRRGLK